jgi:hypothetical protein
MSLEHVQEIANAVLYEGYLLYPYRQSAIKNRQRWTFGVVYPREYSEANGGVEDWRMRTECLVSGGSATTVDVHVRFLHLLVCTVERPEPVAAPASDGAEGHEWSLASRFADEPREEGIERELIAPGLTLEGLAEQPHTLAIAFAGERLVEPAEASDGTPGGTVRRESFSLEGAVTIEAARLADDLYRLTVRIENQTPGTGAIGNQGNAIFRHSFISTHTILQVHGGAFVSLLEPPAELREATEQCVNAHTWPVLAGSEGDHDVMLSSPIILYDYPQIAPESPGSLFDGTEIDEILTLRILTLTDEEKDEMRQGDPRVREVLERSEKLTPEEFMKLHGTIRSMRPVVEGEPG